MTAPVALALSPHLDDAAFSAGGMLARLASEGWRVMIATIFTQSVPDPSAFALACQLDKGLAADVDYMALRRGEDARACACLGAEPIWLPFREAPHRGYGTAAALFAGRHAGDDIVATLEPALRELLSDVQPVLLLAPQAVGGHVDHLALVDAVFAIERTMPTLWWRDYPYAIRKERNIEPFAAAFANCDTVDMPLDGALREARYDAALAYESQLGFQFGGADALRAKMGEQVAETFFMQGDMESLGETWRAWSRVSANARGV